MKRQSVLSPDEGLKHVDKSSCQLKYSFHVKKVGREINGKIKLGEKIIGSLKGFLIHRPKKTKTNFHEVCDSITEEVHNCSVSFFDHHGRLRDEGKNLGEACNYGGYLHIEEVKVDKAHRGKGVGLEMIKTVLDQFEDKWSVAFVLPSPLNEDRYEDRSILNPPKPDKDEIIRLCQHFSRLGFRQISDHTPECEFWALEAANYSGFVTSKEESREVKVTLCIQPSSFNEISHEIQEAIQNFSSVSSSAVLSFTKQIFTLNSGGIQEAFQKFSSDGEDAILNFTSQIALLKSKGGDVNAARALHFAVCNQKVAIVPVLISMGADVNLQDDFGDTPLHAAASVLKPKLIKMILEFGGNKTIRNKKKQTALQVAKENCRDQADFLRAFQLTLPQNTQNQKKMEEEESLKLLKV